jgi:hypothetical protein
MIFVNRTVDSPKATANTAIAELKTQALPSQYLYCPMWHHTLEALVTAGFPSSSPSTRVQFRQEAWTLLRDLYLPKVVAEPQFDLDKTTAYSWLPSACSLQGSSDALDYSLAAFCAIQVDITNRSRKAANDMGLQLYNWGLRELVKDLQQTREDISYETLAAIVVLSTCEVSVLLHLSNVGNANTHPYSSLFFLTTRVGQPMPMEFQRFCEAENQKHPVEHGRISALAFESFAYALCP